MSAAKTTAKQTRLREYTARRRQMKRTSRVVMKREAVIDPSLERTLLSLHAAMSLGSFWKAIQELLAVAIPNRLIGLMLQPNPILPMIARWTLPMPDGFFTAEPLKSYVAAHQSQKFVRISDLFSNRSTLMKSAFYRRYMAPQKMCSRRRPLFLERPKTVLCDCNHAHGDTGRSVAGGDEV